MECECNRVMPCVVQISFIGSKFLIPVKIPLKGITAMFHVHCRVNEGSGLCEHFRELDVGKSEGKSGSRGLCLEAAVTERPMSL